MHFILEVKEGSDLFTFGMIALFASILLLAAGIKIIFSTVLRYNPSSFGLLLAAVFWLAGMAGTQLWPTEAARNSALLLQYSSIAWLAPFLLGLSLGFGQGPSAWRTPLFATLCVVSLIMTLLVFDIPSRGLIFSSVQFDLETGLVTKQPGPFYAPYVLYQGCVAIASLGIILRRSSSMVREEQERARILLGAFLPPIVVALADAGGLRPIPGQNLTAYALLLSAVILFWGMFRARLLSPVFLAKDDLVETMADPVIVSQNGGRILFANLRARELAEGVSKTGDFSFLGDCYLQASSQTDDIISINGRFWRSHSHFVSAGKPKNSAIITVLHDVSVMATQAQELEFLVQERTSQLTELVAEKEQLLHELHHRVKNNLQIIISLIKLQSNRITAETDIHSVCSAMIDRIKSISLVHDRMNRQGNPNGIDFGTYLEDLIGNIAAMYENLVPPPRTQIPLGLFKAELDFCVDFGLVVNELMTNAYKYAVPIARRAPEVTLARLNDGFILTIRDFGPGIHEPNQVRQGSLGLNVVRSILHKYQTSLQWGLDGGAWVSITVPMPSIGLSWYQVDEEHEGGTGNSSR